MQRHVNDEQRRFDEPEHSVLTEGCGFESYLRGAKPRLFRKDGGLMCSNDEQSQPDKLEHSAVIAGLSRIRGGARRRLSAGMPGLL